MDLAFDIFFILFMLWVGSMPFLIVLMVKEEYKNKDKN